MNTCHQEEDLKAAENILTHVLQEGRDAAVHPERLSTIQSMNWVELLDILDCKGPPGCGKTMLARAAAVELEEDASFFHVRPGDVMSKFYGESQRRVQALAQMNGIIIG
eukprot:s5324_g1.t1